MFVAVMAAEFCTIGTVPWFGDFITQNRAMKLFFVNNCSVSGDKDALTVNKKKGAISFYEHSKSYMHTKHIRAVTLSQ